MILILCALVCLDQLNDLSETIAAIDILYSTGFFEMYPKTK